MNMGPAGRPSAISMLPLENKANNPHPIQSLLSQTKYTSANDSLIDSGNSDSSPVGGPSFGLALKWKSMKSGVEAD